MNYITKHTDRHGEALQVGVHIAMLETHEPQPRLYMLLRITDFYADADLVEATIIHIYDEACQDLFTVGQSLIPGRANIDAALGRELAEQLAPTPLPRRLA